MGRRKDSNKIKAVRGQEVSQAINAWGEWVSTRNPRLWGTLTTSKVEVGATYSNLKVITRVSNSKRGQARYACLCNCGTLVDFEAYQFTSGRVRSCGCLQRAAVSKNKGD